MARLGSTLGILVGLLVLGMSAHCGDVAPLINRIKAVGKEGKGNTDAAKAWRELVKQGPDTIFDILAALKDTQPTASNWLRSAVDAIAEKTRETGKPLPAAKLEAFVRDTKNHGGARRLAFEWLVKADASAADRLMPGMLNDPGAELRREAIARVLKDAEKLTGPDNKAAAVAVYKKALGCARDVDQVNLIAKQLKELGNEIDLTAHYGFITRWMIAGPFDNTNEKGFHISYPPDKSVDLAAVYAGKSDKEVRWQEHVTGEPMGLVNLNKIIGKLKASIGYAYTVVTSEKEQPVELRCGSNNAVRMYLNGKEIYGREEYNHGMEMDQHAGKGTLKAGRNEILIKVCQNEEKETWAEPWSFQLRICDELGAAVPVVVVEVKSKS
ncbi:MAG: hypothetical protein HY040_00710 [Planctomycetes bacterium]|nr:hypothetical protein [Planctomycetota bacterium]